MNQTNILFPVMALVGWTLSVLWLIPLRRIGAVRRRLLSGGDFRYGESPNVPGDVSIPNRHYMNLLEMPLLFYVVCITLYVTQKVDVSVLVLAWAYVGFRILHSAVHLTYNHVIHRLFMFAMSSVVLILLWLKTLLELV